MRTKWLLLALSGTFVLASCGFYDCSTERIQGTMAAAIERRGVAEDVQLHSAIAPTNLPASQYEALNALLVGDGQTFATSFVWTFDIFGSEAFKPHPAFFAIHMRAPLSPGETIPVSSTFAQGGWGTVREMPAGLKAWVGVRAGDFVADSVTGTIHVLAVMPLRLRIDLEASSTAGDSIRIAGDMEFELVIEDEPCT